MRRFPPPGGAWIDHIWFPDTSVPEARAAQSALDERRRVRRARLLALIEAERHGLPEDDEVGSQSGQVLYTPARR